MILWRKKSDPVVPVDGFGAEADFVQWLSADETRLALSGHDVTGDALFWTKNEPQRVRGPYPNEMQPQKLWQRA